MASSVLGRRALAAFVESLIEDRLPELDPLQRSEAVGFVVGRWEAMSQLPAVGIGLVATALFPCVWLAGRAAAGGDRRLVGRLAGLRLPLVRDFADFGLSLSAAYAFERWPPAGTGPEQRVG